MLGDMGKPATSELRWQEDKPFLENCLAASHKVKHSPQCLTWVFVHLRKMKIDVDTELCTRMSQAVFFIQPRAGHNPNVHQQKNGIASSWYMDTGGAWGVEVGRLIRHNAEDESREHYAE